MIITCPHLTQWAAVSTHLGWTRVPPQKASLYLFSSATYHQHYYYYYQYYCYYLYHCYNYCQPTCHGHRPGLASVPPMILSAMAIRSPGSWRLEWVCLGITDSDNITVDDITDTDDIITVSQYLVPHWFLYPPTLATAALAPARGRDTASSSWTPTLYHYTGHYVTVVWPACPPCLPLPPCWGAAWSRPGCTRPRTGSPPGSSRPPQSAPRPHTPRTHGTPTLLKYNIRPFVCEVLRHHFIWRWVILVIYRVSHK